MRIGGYDVLSVLGRGGMGVVYEAHDARLGRRVALKVVSPELAADETFLSRFRREGRAQAAVYHENVVALYETGEEGGSPYLVFEHVAGPTLKEKLKETG